MGALWVAVLEMGDVADNVVGVMGRIVGWRLVQYEWMQ